MNRYTYKFFNGLDWKWQNAIVVAHDEVSAEKCLREKMGEYCISKVPYSREEKCSLRLVATDPMPETPFVESISSDM